MNIIVRDLRRPETPSALEFCFSICLALLTHSDKSSWYWYVPRAVACNSCLFLMSMTEISKLMHRNIQARE